MLVRVVQVEDVDVREAEALERLLEAGPDAVRAEVPHAAQ
jgi:hypothetical protein